MKEIRQIQSSISKNVRKATRKPFKLKTLGFCYWMFSSFALLSMVIAVTAPFDQGSIQANIVMNDTAEKVPYLPRGFSFMSVKELEEGKYAFPGQKDALLGEFLMITEDKDVVVSDIKPCYEKVASAPKVRNLRLKIEDKIYSSGIEIKVPADTVRKIGIIGDLSEETISGNRLAVGICDEFNVEIDGKKFDLGLEFPIYDNPASIVGDFPILTI